LKHELLWLNWLEVFLAVRWKLGLCWLIGDGDMVTVWVMVEGECLWLFGVMLTVAERSFEEVLVWGSEVVVRQRYGLRCWLRYLNWQMHGFELR
jgi:hypothetical protein